jgi:ABC-type xylose transport system permease subunit
VVIVAFCLFATFSDPLFLSVTTLTDLLRASVVIGILAVAAMMVLISGGIDVSFTAIAVFAMYSTTVLTLGLMPDMPWYCIFVISIGIGAFLGAINGFFCGDLSPANIDCYAWYTVSFSRLPFDIHRVPANFGVAPGNARIFTYDDCTWND